MGELLPLEQRPSRPQGYHLNALEAAEAELIARLRALRQRRFEAAFVHTAAPAPVPPPPPRHEHAHAHAHRPSLGDREAHGRAGVMHTFNHYHAVEQGDLDKWPGWDAATLQNVFNVYVQYFDGERGLVEERWASAMSADLGDRSPRSLRRARFQAVASAAAAATATPSASPSAWIAFPQMLDLLYSADAQTDEEALSESLGEPLMRRLADDERHLLRRIYGLAHPHGGSQAEAETDEDTRLRPLAKACLRKSRRAHILATMSAHAQIGYGFL